MCRKGNDLVRGLLWNGAKNAAKTNPAVRALYARLMSKGVRGDVAFGYCMTKLLRLVYTIWKTGQAFDRNHYPWDTTAADRSAPTDDETETPAAANVPAPSESPVTTATAQKNAAGLKVQSTEGKEVTAAPSSIDQPDASGKLPAANTDASAGPWISFAALRRQVSMEQVLKHLGIFDRLRRTGTSRSQYRGVCPIHPSDGQQHRSFSVNLDKQAFRCFYPACGAHGNVLDLWAAVRGLTLREAGVDMLTTFHLDAASTANREEEPVKEPAGKPRKRSNTRDAKAVRKKRRK
jgi:hypothetical protein